MNLKKIAFTLLCLNLCCKFTRVVFLLESFLSFLFRENIIWVHSDGQTLHVPAVLTVLPRLYIDLAGALSSADVLCCSLVLQGSSEERSAAEAGDGPVVNMSSSSLSTYLAVFC